jgi:hypothetical protein
MTAARARPTRQNAAARLKLALVRHRQVKDPSLDHRNHAPRLVELRAWQQARLAETYDDLRRQPGFRRAAEFFLNDLYGPQDFTQRDRDVERIYPIMVRLLPAPVLETVARAVDLDTISHELDLRLAAALPAAGTLDRGTYARAYSQTASMAERRHQLALLLALGRELSTIVRRPLIAELLRLCRWPAQLAGLGDLQSFLERGFGAFKALTDARHFLRTISLRERRFMHEMRRRAAQTGAE